MIKNLLKLKPGEALENLSSLLSNATLTELSKIKSFLDSDGSLKFKENILNYIYWTYFFWEHSPPIPKTLQVLYDSWKVILKRCLYCNEKIDVKRCTIFYPQALYGLVCEYHCVGSRRWIMPVKGKKRLFSRKNCPHFRENECPDPIWLKGESI